MAVKEYKFDGETFQVDDSEGCYARVTYKDQVGFVGVNLSGTKDAPYTWSDIPRSVTPEGISEFIIAGPTLEENLKALCKHLIKKHWQEKGQAAFDKKAACDTLHEAVRKLGTEGG